MNQSKLDAHLNTLEKIRIVHATAQADIPAVLSCNLMTQICDNVGVDATGKIGVLYTVELACYLECIGCCDITLITKDYDAFVETYSKKSIGCDYMTLDQAKAQNMKFDSVLTNPPYGGQSQLHQKFFNVAVDLLKDGGTLGFVQPASPYFNKKEDTQAANQEMRDNIKRYKTKVTFLSPDVFETAKNANDIALTILTKTETQYEELESVTYRSGTTYKKVKLENINQPQIDPVVYESIRQKYLLLVKANGCLTDLISTDSTQTKAKISTIRGNVGKTDWYTFMSGDTSYWGYTGDFGIKANSNQEVDNIYVYLKTKFARFGLALYKFATDLRGGAMNGVPVVLFTQPYTDQDLFTMIGLTQAEQDVINSVIPDYY